MKVITIAGRVGKDAVTRSTQSGDQVTGFTVAVDEGYGDNKRTLWFDVSMWGKRGVGVAPYLTKGANVTVTGELSTREHEGKTYLTIRETGLALQGGKRDASPASDNRGAPSGNYGSSLGGNSDMGLDDDLPF